MSPELIQIISAVLPMIILLGGGQLILNMYAQRQKEKEIDLEIKRKERELEIELHKAREERKLDLIRSVREIQYSSITELYSLFARLMELYRIADPKTKMTDMGEPQARDALLKEAIKVEAAIDALILKIGVEFGTIAENAGKATDLSALLGNLRQSVQKWRESFRSSKPLPFTHHLQDDYVRFKQCFVSTAIFLVNQLYTQFQEPIVNTEIEAWRVIVDAFDNKHEVLNKWKPIVD